jgi:hypothetical protein
MTMTYNDPQKLEWSEADDSPRFAAEFSTRLLKKS